MRRIVIAALVATCLAGTAEARRASQMFAPANDEIANAKTLAPSPWLVAGHLLFASKQASEPKVDAASIGRSVWYRYTATKNRRVAVVIAPNKGASVPFRIAVYEGSQIGALTLRGRASIATGTSTPASVVFDATEGVTYTVQVDSGPQTTLNGYFLIGLQHFTGDTPGGVGLFAERPVYVTEGAGATRTVFAVNATRSTAVLTPRLDGLSEALSAAASTTAVAPGGVVPVTVSDNVTLPLPATGSTVGTLSVGAVVSATTIATQKLAVTGVKLETTNAATVRTRFDRPGQGGAVTDVMSSAVTVWNTGGTPARACRFEPGDSAMTLHFSELTAGKTANADKLFDIPAGGRLVYAVRVAGAAQNDDTVRLVCGHASFTTTTDDLSRMFGYEQFGEPSIARIAFSGLTADQTVSVPDFGVRTVVAAVVNTGSYAGFFDIAATTPDATRARVASLCESSSTGVCKGLSASGKVTVNLANGEKTYVALTVARQNVAASGFVFVTATSIDSPTARTAAYDGFEVVAP